MIENKYYDQLVDQVRLSYAHSIKMHISQCKNYQSVKEGIKDENLKKDFHKVDRFYFNESGKLNWETIRKLMPLGIEKKIKKEYDMLNENEIRLCCLLFFNVPGVLITEILPYTKRSIHSITYRIKKKAGISNIKESLKNLLFTPPND